MLVGGIACRYEKSASGSVRLYLMTLGVLAPYRGRGVGQRLLVRALTHATKDAAVEDVYLHVQVNNEEAIAFYKKFGFEARASESVRLAHCVLPACVCFSRLTPGSPQITETLPGYYKRLEPSDCHILSRSLKGWAPPAGLALEGDDESNLTLDAP